MLKNIILISFLTLTLNSCGSTSKNTSSAFNSNSSIKNISVLSFNVYLLKHAGLVNYIDQRSILLPEAIAKLNADVVLLQEVFQVDDDFPKYLAEQLGDENRFGDRAYKYHYHMDVASEKTPYGSGLMIFSKYKIVKTDFVPWDDNDFTSNQERKSKKGILMAVIDIPEVGHVQFFNSHTSALDFDKTERSFVELPTDENGNHARDRQIDTLINYILKEREDNNYCQVLGIDLNSHFLEWDSNLNMYSNKINKDFAKVTKNLGFLPDFDINEYFSGNLTHDDLITWNKDNFWVKVGLFDYSPSSKLDYIFVQENKKVNNSNYYCMYGRNSERVFTETEYEYETSIKRLEMNRNYKVELSDHYGVLSNVAFRKNIKN